MRAITALVVHCSATPAGKAFRSADIDRWHKSQGWESIGYHFVITLDGGIEDGRPLKTPGAHVKQHNSTTIGICYIGGLSADGKRAENTLNEAQERALEFLLRTLREKWPMARILGHRDFAGVAKACPSFDVTDWCKAHGLDPRGSAILRA